MPRGLLGWGSPPRAFLGRGMGAAWGRLPQYGLSAPAFLSVLPWRAAGRWGPCILLGEPPRMAGLAGVFVGPRETPETAGPGRSPCFPPGLPSPRTAGPGEGVGLCCPLGIAALLGSRDLNTMARPGARSVPLRTHPTPRATWPGGVMPAPQKGWCTQFPGKFSYATEPPRAQGQAPFSLLGGFSSPLTPPLLGSAARLGELPGHGSTFRPASGGIWAPPYLLKVILTPSHQASGAVPSPLYRWTD